MCRKLNIEFMENMLGNNKCQIMEEWRSEREKLKYLTSVPLVFSVIIKKRTHSQSKFLKYDKNSNFYDTIIWGIKS